MSIREGSPLDLVQKKIDELKKEKGRITAAIDTYDKLFTTIYEGHDVNLSDVLKLQELGSTEFNKEIEKRKGKYRVGAMDKGHEIDENYRNGLYCKKCDMNVYDATLVNCPNSTSAASQPSSSSANPWADFHMPLPQQRLEPYVLPAASQPASSSAAIPIPPPFELQSDAYALPTADALRRRTTYFTGGRLKKSTLRKRHTHRKKRTLHKRR